MNSLCMPRNERSSSSETRSSRTSGPMPNSRSPSKILFLCLCHSHHRADTLVQSIAILWPVSSKVIPISLLCTATPRTIVITIRACPTAPTVQTGTLTCLTRSNLLVRPFYGSSRYQKWVEAIPTSSRRWKRTIGFRLNSRNGWRAFALSIPHLSKQRLRGLELDPFVDNRLKQRCVIYPFLIAASNSLQHPIVRVHPVTGEKALFINPGFTRRIAGFKEEESRALLDFLIDHITKGADFQIRARYEPGTVVVWDNRVTAHSANPDFNPFFRRHCVRLTPQAEAPIAAEERH